MYANAVMRGRCINCGVAGPVEVRTAPLVRKTPGGTSELGRLPGESIVAWLAERLAAIEHLPPEAGAITPVGARR